MPTKALSKAVNQATFNALLAQAWRASDNKARMAIALSGGQDSMALAALCENYRKDYSRQQFTAFIVDHAVRPESHDEAVRIRNIVRTKTGIDVEILKLTWTSHVHPLKLFDFESIARRLRYQALAKACLERDITTMLVGHHSNDQAETVVMRMYANYMGGGLAGIQPDAAIPECDGMYGCHSGRPIKVPLVPVAGFSLSEKTFMVEDGGIRIHRPLLNFTKDELRATCIENGMKWAEDKTNSDKTLGPRNAIRHLVDHARLPEAIRTRNLLELAKSRQADASLTSDHVQHIFSACTIRMNPTNGTVDVRFPEDIGSLLFADTSTTLLQARQRAALLVRKLMLLVSPMMGFKLADTRGPAEIMFPFLFSATEHYKIEHGQVATAAKVFCRITSPTFSSTNHLRSSICCQFTRTPPSAQDKLDQVKTLVDDPTSRSESFNWSDTAMVLFDGRYWIRLRYRLFNLSPGHRISVRFLEESDLDQLRTDETMTTHWRKLKQTLKEKAPGKIRYTLPAIVQTSFVTSNNGKQMLQSRLLALPSLGWSSAGWVEYDKKNFQEAWMWSVRFKKIDFRGQERHQFVG